MAHNRELHYTPEQIEYLEKIQHELQLMMHNFIAKNAGEGHKLGFDSCDFTEQFSLAYAAVLYDRVIKHNFGEKINDESAVFIDHAFTHIAEGWLKMFSMLTNPAELLRQTPLHPPKEKVEEPLKEMQKEEPKEEQKPKLDPNIPFGVTWQ
jgi:hypothetical protein